MLLILTKMLTFGHTRLVRHKTSCKKPGFISIHNTYVLENDGVVHSKALCVRSAEERSKEREGAPMDNALTQPHVILAI